MEEHLRFAIAYWHTFTGTGGDPFGAPTKNFPWLVSSDPIQCAFDKMDAAFELSPRSGFLFIAFMITIS